MCPELFVLGVGVCGNYVCDLVVCVFGVGVCRNYVCDLLVDVFGVGVCRNYVCDLLGCPFRPLGGNST